MKVESLDHLVLTVRDVDASARFHERVLGMKIVRFGEGRTALHFGRQKLNLHAAGRELVPHARTPTPGSADLCLLVDTPAEALLEHLAREGVQVIEGPVMRTGARGPVESIYIRDLDENLLELAREV